MEQTKVCETRCESEQPSKLIEMGRVSEETKGQKGLEFEGAIPNDFPG
jgi:hypothetical protein